MPTLSDAIATIKAGRREEGRVMLTQILVQDGNNVTALLWMSEVAKTPEERRTCLKQILAIDPNNAPASMGLELLDSADKPLPSTAIQPLTRQPTAAATANDQRTSPDERTPQETTRRCPFCQKIILADSSFCRFCGREITATTTPAPVGVSTIDASNIGIVTGIIIVSLIILGLLWVGVGIGFFNMTRPILLAGGDIRQATIFGIISFILAVANLLVIKGVVLHRPSTEQRLALVAILGCMGALLAFGMLESPIVILAIPLYIVVEILFSTVKKVPV